MVGLNVAMPNAKLEDPAFWRAIAQEARELAAKMGLAEPMISVSTYYDRIAERLVAKAGASAGVSRMTALATCHQGRVAKKTPPVRN